MTTTTSTSYEQFLERSTGALMSAGGQSLLPPHPDRSSLPAWAQPWDQLLLLNSPGSLTLFAFRRAGMDEAGRLRTLLDELVRGLSSRGVLATGAPTNLVAIPVFPGGVDKAVARKLTRLTPSQFFPGIRPSMAVADLRSGVLYSRMSWTKPVGFDLLQQSAQGTLPESAGGGSDLHVLQRRAVERTQDFYQLMQGRQPVVTYALIAVNVLIFLLLYANGGPQSDTALRNFGALSPKLIQQGQWWRLCTSMFLHAGITHIVFNMTSLFAVGTLAERLYGSAKFLAIYLGAGLIGSIVSFGYAVVSNNTDVLGVGASGAIFGVAGALVTVRFQHSNVIPQSVRNRVSSSILPLVALSLGLSYLTPHVDNSAHLGGLLGGMALSFLLPLTRAMSREFKP